MSWFFQPLIRGHLLPHHCHSHGHKHRHPPQHHHRYRSESELVTDLGKHVFNVCTLRHVCDVCNVCAACTRRIFLQNQPAEAILHSVQLGTWRIMGLSK